MSDQATGQCPNCHQANPYSAQVCEFCGRRLPWAAQQQRAEQPPVPAAGAATAGIVPLTPVQAANAATGRRVLTGCVAVGCGLPVLAFVILLIIGAWSSGGPKPYTILNTTYGPGQTTVEVQVPPGSTIQQMQGWAPEIVNQQPRGISVMMNFYDGPKSDSTFVASYQGGTVYDMRDKR